MRWERTAVGVAGVKGSSKGRHLNLTKTPRAKTHLLTASRAGKTRGDDFVFLEDQGICQDSAFMPLPVWPGWAPASLPGCHGGADPHSL